MYNKYHATRTYSELCQRRFDSKGEAIRAEQLCLLEKSGEIKRLEYQVLFTLCVKPRITISIDFHYLEQGVDVYEDFKGILTRDSRTKLAWLKEKYGIPVRLIRRDDL